MGTTRSCGSTWPLSRVLAGLAFALAAGSPALAPAQPTSAVNGAFSVFQIATTDPDGLLRRWAVPSPTVSLTTASQMKRNQPIYTFIIFKGCRRDPAGACDVVVRFEVLSPSGKPYNAPQEAEVWGVSRPPPLDGAYQLSVGALGIGIEDDEPLGAYRVRATVTDKVSGVSLRTEQVLTAVAN